MSSAASSVGALAPSQISFVDAGSRPAARRASCGQRLQGLYGCRSEDGVFRGRLVVLSCGGHECPVDAPRWAEGQAGRILSRRGGRLVHVQLTTCSYDVRTERDLEAVFAETRSLLRRAGVKRGWLWAHASGVQVIRGDDQIIDVCPSEFHVHAVVEADGPVSELGQRIDSERWGVRVPFTRRRTRVVRNRPDLEALLLRSSKAVTNNSTGPRRVVRSFGRSRGSREAVKPVAEAQDAASEPPDPLVNCACCGKIHPKSLLGYWKLVDNTGRRVDVPWDDDQIHELHDGENGLHLVRVLSKHALLFGGES